MADQVTELAKQPLTQAEAKLLRYLVEYKLAHAGQAPRAKTVYKAHPWLSTTKVNRLMDNLSWKRWIVIDYGDWTNTRIVGEAYAVPAWYANQFLNFPQEPNYPEGHVAAPFMWQEADAQDQQIREEHKERRK